MSLFVKDDTVGSNASMLTKLSGGESLIVLGLQQEHDMLDINVRDQRLRGRKVASNVEREAMMPFR